VIRRQQSAHITPVLPCQLGDLTPGTSFRGKAKARDGKGTKCKDAPPFAHATPVYRALVHHHDEAELAVWLGLTPKPRPKARKGGCRCCWWSPKTSCSMRGAKKSSRSAVALRKSRVTQPRHCDCELRSRRHAARQSLSRNAVLVMRLRAPRPEPLAYAAASSPSHPRPAAATTHGRKHTIHRDL